jgi:outer membrane protein
MKAPVISVALAMLLSAAPVVAQAPQAPASQPPAPATQPPAPATQPPAPATQNPAPAAAPAPAVPFPAGEKIGYVDLQGVMAQSADGKAAQAKLQAETKRRQSEAEGKAKAMQANQQKLQTSGSIMSAEARAQLERDIERQQREGERYEQDAQAELNELQQQLQREYNRKLFPVLEQMAKEMGLSMLFSAGDSGLIWTKPGLNLTGEAVKRMDVAPTPKPEPVAPTAPKPPSPSTIKPAPGAKP